MRAAFRVAAALAVIAISAAIFVPLQMVALRLDRRGADKFPRWWFATACRVIGLRIRVEGRAAPPPVLLAANHVSWLDIAVISSVMPVSFVAKSEVRGWPLIGFLSTMQQTVFVDRSRRTATAAANDTVAGRLGEGHAIVLFAEGTTGDGNRILPFRSALLGAAEAPRGGAPVAVQPLAIVYTALRGLPLAHAERPLIAWYGDMDLAPHFARIVGIGAIDVTLKFGEPIPLASAADRKKAAAACYRAVRRMAAEIQEGPSSSTGHFSALFSGAGKGAKGTTPAGEKTAPGERLADRIS